MLCIFSIFSDLSSGIEPAVSKFPGSCNSLKWYNFCSCIKMALTILSRTLNHNNWMILKLVMGQCLTTLNSILAKPFPGSLFISPPDVPKGANWNIKELFYMCFQSLLLRYQLICIKVQWLKSFIFKTSQNWFLKYMIDIEIHKVPNSWFRFAKYRYNP